MDSMKQFAKILAGKFKEDNLTLLAASLAYYFLLSIFPLLIVGFAIIPYFDMTPDDALGMFATVMPQEIVSLLEENIIRLIETPRGGLLTVGIIGSLWSASNGINAFIQSSNEAFHVEETRSFIFVRLISLGLTLGLILSVVVAILVPVFGGMILKWMMDSTGLSAGMGFTLQLFRWGISIIVLTTFIMLLYRFAPNKKIPFRHILPGAFVASIIWQIISFGFSIYVSNFGNYSATYGTLGGIIILMIWFFLTGLILLFGASITAVHHRMQTEKKAGIHHAVNG
mgnify:CR=1 FL=1